MFIPLPFLLGLKKTTKKKPTCFYFLKTVKCFDMWTAFPNMPELSDAFLPLLLASPTSLILSLPPAAFVVHRNFAFHPHPPFFVFKKEIFSIRTSVSFCSLFSVLCLYSSGDGQVFYTSDMIANPAQGMYSRLCSRWKSCA